MNKQKQSEYQLDHRGNEKREESTKSEKKQTRRAGSKVFEVSWKYNKRLKMKQNLKAAQEKEKSEYEKTCYKCSGMSKCVLSKQRKPKQMLVC